VWDAARRTPDAPALLFAGRTWTYAQLNAWVARWTLALAEKAVGAGDRVAVLAPNRPEVVALLFAARRRGATLTPLNVRLARPELTTLLSQLHPKVLWVDSAYAAQWPEALPLDSVGEETSPPAVGTGSPPVVPGERPWLVLFTSGTTGRPKGAVLTVGNLESHALLSGRTLGADAAQRWLGTLPLFHIGGLAMAARCARYGASLLLHPRFDAMAVRVALECDGVTHASFVAQTLNAVLDAGEAPLRHTLRAVLLGGGPAPETLVARAREQGIPVLHTYGLTEASSQVCTERLGAADGKSCGVPLPEVLVRVAGDSGVEVGPGVEGEVWVRGPTVMAGYLDDPTATSQALQNGWLRTGDLGTKDAQGRLSILARRTDLIISGGENIYPAELEAVLSEHPDVAEVGVVGAKDAQWGEVPVAFWVSRRVPAAESALVDFARTRVAGFKVPRRFERVDSLPRNAMGKVDRVALRALLGSKDDTSGVSPR
jgi:O-succinylbenzoic acid--CoA ligase